MVGPERGRADGRCVRIPGRPLRPLPDGTVRSAVGSLRCSWRGRREASSSAIPARREGRDGRAPGSSPGDSGSGAGAGRARPCPAWVRQPRPATAARTERRGERGSRWEGARSRRASRDVSARVRGRGERGGRDRAGGSARPGTTGTRSQGSRSVSALGKRQHGNKMAGKGWDCHGQPRGAARPAPAAPGGARGARSGTGSGARAPPGMCRRSPAPPGWAPVQPQLQKMAARRSPLNPAGGGGGGDGEEAAARPSPAAAPPGARGRRRGGGREPAGRPERSPESVRSLPPGPHLRRGGGTPSTCRPGRGAAVAHRRAEGTPLPPATWRRPFSRSVGKKENEINKIKPGAAARARRCEAAATPQRKVGPATPRRAAAPRPPPRPFSIVCPRGGGGGRAWERSHRLLPTGVRSPRQRGAVIARVRVSRGRPRNAAAAPRGSDAPRGETAARVGAAGGTERRRTREERGGAGAARGHRERRGEDAGTAAPARHVVRGAARSRGEEKPPVLRGAPVSVSESGFPARARPRGPAVRGVRRVSRRPPAERRRCHRSTALPFPLATRTAAEGQRGAEGAASGRPSGGTGPGVGGWGGAAGGGPAPRVRSGPLVGLKPVPGVGRRGGGRVIAQLRAANTLHKSSFVSGLSEFADYL